MNVFFLWNEFPIFSVIWIRPDFKISVATLHFCDLRSNWFNLGPDCVQPSNILRMTSQVIKNIYTQVNVYLNPQQPLQSKAY